MSGLPAPKTRQIIDRINALQVQSAYFVRLDEVSARTRDCRAIKREIDELFAVDAAAAWELVGAWSTLSADVAEMTRAFEASIKIADTGTNRVNYAINNVAIGMFSAAQETCAQFEAAAGEGNAYAGVATATAFLCGALSLANRLAAKARAMRQELDPRGSVDLAVATDILGKAGISEAAIAKHLDIAGAILRSHNMRPRVEPRVTAAEGFFSGVTYAFHVPVSASEAFEMNIELATAESEAGIEKNIAFDVVFEAA